MNWQEWIVWFIGWAVAWWLGRRIGRFIRRMRDGQGSCDCEYDCGGCRHTRTRPVPRPSGEPSAHSVSCTAAPTPECDGCPLRK